MTTTLFSKFAYRLMLLFVSIVYFFSPVRLPALDDPVQGCGDTGAKLTFVAWADPQISNYQSKRFQYIDNACEDLSRAHEGVDALVIAGDLAENGLKCEYEYLTEQLLYANVDNFIISVGNHDFRLRNYKNTVKTFTSFINGLNKAVGSRLTVDSLHYSYDIKGYRFIVLGTDKTEFEESYLSDSQLEWLDGELQTATRNGRPAFVIIHQSPKLTHGLPDTWNSPFDAAGSVGDQSDELCRIMNKYRNVFLLTGHLHTGIGKYTYEKIGNINSVNLPSLTINNKDGDCNDNGIGFVCEVYGTHVLFRARCFATGKYLPDFNIDVPVVK